MRHPSGVWTVRSVTLCAVLRASRVPPASRWGTPYLRCDYALSAQWTRYGAPGGTVAYKIRVGIGQSVPRPVATNLPMGCASRVPPGTAVYSLQSGVHPRVYVKLKWSPSYSRCADLRVYPQYSAASLGLSSLPAQPYRSQVMRPTGRYSLPIHRCSHDCR